MPSGVMSVAPLQVDDSPRPRHGLTKPLGDERVRFGAGHSYIRKRFKQRARKGTLEFVCSNLNEE